jgi:hypothetical protein
LIYLQILQTKGCTASLKLHPFDKLADMQSLVSVSIGWRSSLKASDHQSAVPSSNITPAPDLPWTLIGSADESLLSELGKMYWEGVRQELEVILLTLKKWQQPEYSSVLLKDETDGFIHGFDTFIDQVSQESRAFASRYGVLWPFPVL